MSHEKEHYFPGPISEAEVEIVRTSGISSAPWEQVVSQLALPELEAGKSIVDVGGGASDAVAHFLDLGIDAYAIDPFYTNEPDLLEGAHFTIDKLLENRIMPKELELRWRSAIDTWVESSKKNPEKYIPAMASNLPFDDVSEMPDADEHLVVLNNNQKELFRMLDRNTEVKYRIEQVEGISSKRVVIEKTSASVVFDAGH